MTEESSKPQGNIYINKVSFNVDKLANTLASISNKLDSQVKFLKKISEIEDKRLSLQIQKNTADRANKISMEAGNDKTKQKKDKEEKDKDKKDKSSNLSLGNIFSSLTKGGLLLGGLGLLLGPDNITKIGKSIVSFITKFIGNIKLDKSTAADIGLNTIGLMMNPIRFTILKGITDDLLSKFKNKDGSITIPFFNIKLSKKEVDAIEAGIAIVAPWLIKLAFKKIGGGILSLLGFGADAVWNKLKASFGKDTTPKNEPKIDKSKTPKTPSEPTSPKELPEKFTAPNASEKLKAEINKKGFNVDTNGGIRDMKGRVVPRAIASNVIKEAEQAIKAPSALRSLGRIVGKVGRFAGEVAGPVTAGLSVLSGLQDPELKKAGVGPIGRVEYGISSIPFSMFDFAANTLGSGLNFALGTHLKTDQNTAEWLKQQQIAAQLAYSKAESAKKYEALGLLSDVEKYGTTKSNNQPLVLAPVNNTRQGDTYNNNNSKTSVTIIQDKGLDRKPYLPSN